MEAGSIVAKHYALTMMPVFLNELPVREAKQLKITIIFYIIINVLTNFSMIIQKKKKNKRIAYPCNRALV